jgi:hypothetical protein
MKRSATQGNPRGVDLNMTNPVLRPRELVCAAVLALVLPLAFAQTATLGTAQDVHSVGIPPLADGTPLLLQQAPYAASSVVERVAVEVERNALPADGQSATAVLVRLFGSDGKPVQTEVVVTLEVSAGRLLMPGARTDELGPGRTDVDPALPGTQVRVRSGELRFTLVAPDTPQDVRLRVTAGSAQATGAVSFVPETRGFIAVGLIEGVIRLSRKDPSLVQPVRLDDGFEAELRRFSRSFNDGKSDAAVRGALFLKGKILGGALLTASFDSEKETRARLLRDIKPDEFYPVYGDASVKGFEAQSSSRLYLRVDKNKSYALFGDFSTGDGFAAEQGAAGVAPTALKTLGAYNRTLTGLRGQWTTENGVATAGAFAAYDTLKQVTEEFRATGTSGPFVLRNNSALENSEKIEVLVRHKDNPGLIKTQRPLQRLDDYGFEPFSGRILLNRPLGSVDPQGDPVSLRVTYEVDQGGERFVVAGVEGSVAVGQRTRVGAALVRDQNPASPAKLASVHMGTQLADRTWLTAEVARSESTVYEVGTQTFSNPTQQAGEERVDRTGHAARVALQHQGSSTTLDATAIQTDTGFYNPGAPLSGGRSEATVKGTWRLTEQLHVFGEALRGRDKTADGTRQGAALGLGVKLGQRLNVQGGVRVLQEDGGWNAGVPVITPNPTPGSSSMPTGGLLGGTDAVTVNPATGQSLASYAPVSTQAAGQGISVDATTLFLGAQFAATERLSVEGLVEGAVDGQHKHRLVLGGAYRVGERSRLVARYEDQSGLTSAYGATRSNALSVGADTQYMPGGQLFSEYRLRDATSREAWWANGVRNTWALREGVTATTAMEYLRVLDGQGGDAAAIALGYDYTAHPLWKLASKLEWRRVFDNRRLPGDEQSDSVLSTVALARKMNRDWTLLVRNHLLANRYAQGPGGMPAGIGSPAAGAYTALQDRLQIGAAFRPVDHNRFDVLSKYEFRFSHNANGQVGLKEAVHVASVQANYHPSRPWWFTARLAAKSREESGLSAQGKTRYDAALLSGRLVYDISENIDIGFMAATLVGGPNGNSLSSLPRSRQSALGLEVGYLVKENLWLSAGYNWRGFSDADLTASEYTNSGVYMRLRLKFDEDLFASTSRAINRTLDRAAAAIKP